MPLTQDDLAGLCGTTRPTVNRLLSKLCDRQLVELTRGRVVITDLEDCGAGRPESRRPGPVKGPGLVVSVGSRAVEAVGLTARGAT